MTEVAPDSQARSAPAVVIPHSPTTGRRLAARIVYSVLWALEHTVRYQRNYHPGVLQNQNRPVIFCIWHNRLALALPMHANYSQTVGQDRQLAAMVSASRDGGMLARVLELFGTQPVRGSSSRRGRQALLELTRWSERGCDLAITPDGPRGPRYIVQPGVVALAQLTGRPIIPGGLRIYWKKCLKSWDRFQLPLPFTRVEMYFGEPLTVRRDASDDEREAIRNELQNRLLAINQD